MHHIRVLQRLLHHMNMLTSINFKTAKEKEGLSTVLILDGLEDPHNLGSILRTADATGVDGVIIPKRRSVTLTQTVAKPQQVQLNMYQLFE